MRKARKELFEVYEGYGPLDLIERVRKAGFVKCVPDGQNFLGMNLGGYALTDTPDDLAPIKYRVTLAAVEAKDKFVVEGYCFKDLLLAVEKGEPVWGKTTFAGEELKDFPEVGTRLYRVTIEVI